MSELESVDLSAVTAPPAEKPAEREGLPPGYKMRADAHYVDQLTSRRSERPPEIGRGEAPRTDSRRAPEGPGRDDAREPRGRRGDKVLAQMSEDIATIQSAAALLAGESSAVARRVSVDLIRAHAWRAGWLFRAHQILEGLHRSHIRPRPLGPILQQIRDSLAPECRLSGCRLSIQTNDWNQTVNVDEEGMVAGVSGAVLATLGLAGGHDGIAIAISAVAADGELLSIEVSQDAVQLGPAVGGRFHDASWTDRPGGWTAGLGASVAKSVAHLANGEAVFLASEKHGSTVRFTFRSTR